MDLRQIEYIVQIAEENNITRAAEKLYITQSALNQQLLKLEKELGVPLFHRSRTDWHPTKAGEIYLKTARQMLQMKKDTYYRIHDLVNIQKGQLSVGFTPGRGITMFSHVYPKFHRLHPNITVTPVELSVQKQQAHLLSGNLDLGFVTLVPSQQKASLHYIPLAEERILAAVPIRHPIATPLDEKPSEAKASDPSPVPSCSKDPQDFTELRVLDLHLLREEPFVLIYHESTLRQLTDHIFQKAGFIPQALFETSNNAAIATMVSAEMCCGLIPEYYARKNKEGIRYFTLPDHPSWNIMACCHKNRYISQTARDFISLAQDFFLSSI